MRIFFLLILLPSICINTQALELEPPPPPGSSHLMIPEEGTSFGTGLWELFEKALAQTYPDLREAALVCCALFCAVLLVSLPNNFSGNSKKVLSLCGAFIISSGLLGGTKSMIQLSVSTVTEISEYGKLLLKCLTAAMAAQGGLTASAALYAGTAVFNTLLTTFLTRILVPMIHLFLALGIANAATGQDSLKRIKDFIKWILSWFLKTALTVFTTYLTVTGVVSGTTDAASVKAAKVMISSFVPVIGSILSDASESVLVSASLAKNAAGVYGIFALISIFLVPFLKIAIQYLMLKGTGMICELFNVKSMSALIEDFSSAMGFLLAMVGSVCLLLLISTICFLKGVG